MILTAFFVVFVFLCLLAFKFLSGFWLVLTIFVIVMVCLSVLGSMMSAVFGAKF